MGLMMLKGKGREDHKGRGNNEQQNRKKGYQRIGIKISNYSMWLNY